MDVAVYEVVIGYKVVVGDNTNNGNQKNNPSIYSYPLICKLVLCFISVLPGEFVLPLPPGKIINHLYTTSHLLQFLLTGKIQ
jgi:hypothetical protein